MAVATIALIVILLTGHFGLVMPSTRACLGPQEAVSETLTVWG